MMYIGEQKLVWRLQFTGVLSRINTGMLALLCVLKPVGRFTCPVGKGYKGFALLLLPLFYKFQMELL